MIERTLCDILPDNTFYLPSSTNLPYFSIYYKSLLYLPQVPCWCTCATTLTHKIITPPATSPQPRRTEADGCSIRIKRLGGPLLIISVVALVVVNDADIIQPLLLLLRRGQVPGRRGTNDDNGNVVFLVPLGGAGGAAGGHRDGGIPAWTGYDRVAARCCARLGQRDNVIGRGSTG